MAATVQNLGATVGTLAGIGAPGELLKNVELTFEAYSAAYPARRSTVLRMAAATKSSFIPRTTTHRPFAATSPDRGGPYELTWRRADLPVGETAHFGGDNSFSNSPTPVSGIFFRHELPYFVTIHGKGNYLTQSDTVITSPDKSETDFFPVKRSFFANNAANITITDGVITGVDQTTKSEVAASSGPCPPHA